MRYLVCTLLLPSLLASTLSQDNDAEKLVRDLEKKLQATNAVQIVFDIEIRAIKGREDESRLKDKVGKANGSLLFTKDNKARLIISSEYGLELVSDGKQLRLATDQGEARSIAKAKPMPAPKHLYALLSSLSSRAGMKTGSMIITFAPGPQFELVFLKGDFKDFDPDKMRMGVWDFKAGAAEKVGGRDAKVVRYRLGEEGDKSEEPVTLWLDAKTLLPLKRVISIKSENMHITETYTEFTLDHKIDAKAFEMVPSKGNEAEKLFRAVEEKIKAAKAVQFTFDTEIKSKDKQASSKGSLLFTKDNKARLKMIGNETGKEVTTEMISDGKRMKRAESPESLAKAEEEPTPTNLHSVLSELVSIPGLMLTYDRLSPGPAAPMFGLVYFNAGAADKVGGRDAKVVSYNVILLGGTCEVTLWIDAETMLPLKRVIVAEAGEKVEAVRITEMCNFDLNPKIEAGAFALPK